MPNFDFKIEGAKQLDEALRRIGPDLERKVAKSAIRAGATIVAKSAREKVPVDQGTLKNSIRVVARSKRVGDAVVSVVTRAGKKWRSRNMDAWYAPLVEFGAKKMSARPFMRPALDENVENIVRKVSEKIQQRLSKLARG